MNDSMNECVIEWIRGDKLACVTMPSSTKLCNKIKRMNPDFAEIEMIENADGSIFATVPVSWVKISPPRKVSEEQKALASERLKTMWSDRRKEQ